MYRVLIAAKNEEFARSLSDIIRLYAPQITFCTSAGEARRKTNMSDFDTIFISSPLPDEPGNLLAEELAQDPMKNIVLFVKAQYAEQYAQSIKASRVYTLVKPFSRQHLNEALTLLSATESRLRDINKKMAVMAEKLDYTKLENRAKLLLIQKKSLGENEAHKLIEKRAMDERISKKEAVQAFIDELF